MKTRNLHVLSGANGGVERYVQSLIRNMDKTKYENIVLCSNDFQDCSFSGIAEKMDRINIHRELSFVKDFQAFMQLRKKLKEYAPDIVYLHSSKPGAIGRLAAVGLPCRVVYNPHGWAFRMCGSRRKAVLYKCIEKLLAPLAHRIIVISEKEKELAFENKICKPGKITVVLNGIEMDSHTSLCVGYAPNKQDLGIGPDAYIIGTVARITQQKSPDIFVKAADIIKNKIPHAFFLWVGDGPDREQMEREIEHEGLTDRFLITGWVPNVAGYIALFDQAMLISRWEGFGLVLAEYMMMSKPIIATDVDAIPEVVTNNVTGMLVPVDNADAIAKAILQLFKDRALARRLGHNGSAEALNRFNITRVVQETQTVIEEILR